MFSKETVSRSTSSAVALFAVTAAVVAYPPVYSVLHAGARGLVAQVRGDALLYLTIARNSTGMFFTYDGTTPTNGFHPLWGFYLAALIPHTTPVASLAPLKIAFLSSVVATALGAAFAALAIYRYTRSLLLGFLVVPGVYYVVCGSLFSNLRIWEAVGGMESGFSILFGGLFLYLLARAVTGPNATFDDLYARRGFRNPLVPMGLVLPLIILSRLDDVFLIPGFLLVLFLLDDRRRPWRDRVVAAAQLVGPACALLAVYMLFNKISAGSFTPLSGQTKGGFVLAKNLYVTLAGMFPPLIDLKNALSARKSEPWSLYLNAFRWAELLAPPLICGVYVAWYHARQRGVLRYALPVGLALGVILKALYNLANVHLWHQSYWYFALATLVVSFLAAIPLGRLADRLRTERVLRRAIPMAYALYVVIAAARFAEAVAYDPTPDLEYAYLTDSPQITAKLQEGRSGVKLLAFDDGITGYSLPFPTMHGFGFAADQETCRALSQGRLLRHAHARGHRILTSGTYLPVTTALPSSEAVRHFLNSSILEEGLRGELDLFDFQLLYVHEQTGSPFIEFTPRSLRPEL